MKIIETKKAKALVSKDCNYFFRKDNGFMATWGKTKEDDPDFSPYGPFILDLEISTICHGGCSFCYKSNTGKGENMSFETFKTILHKMPSCFPTIVAMLYTYTPIQRPLDWQKLPISKKAGD